VKGVAGRAASAYRMSVTDPAHRAIIIVCALRSIIVTAFVLLIFSSGNFSSAIFTTRIFTTAIFVSLSGLFRKNPRLVPHTRQSLKRKRPTRGVFW
jgi:hypothetical protein